MHRVRTGLAALALSLACPPALAQAPDRLADVADQLAKANHFSGTMLVAQGDHVLLERAYGEANVEWGIHNTPATRFRLGSVTKQFTAASVLLLQERGKLKVSDPIGQYLPDLPVAWHAVTIRQLLTHTAGIHSFTDVPQYAGMERQATRPADILAAVRDLPLDFAPGSRFAYSNSGYVVLGMLVEQAGGMPYAQFIQRNIFDPLGMKDSGYDSNATLVARRAAGYVAGPHGLQNAGYIDMSVPYAAGGLYSTTADLLRWQRALYEGKLLSADDLRAMTTPFRSGYAFGLVVSDGPDGRQFGHDGGIEGFSTLVGYRPAEGISVILLSNVEGSQLDGMGSALFLAARGRPVLLPSERREVAPAPERVRQAVGTYALPDGTPFWFRSAQGVLQVRLGKQPWVPVFGGQRPLFRARRRCAIRDRARRRRHGQRPDDRAERAPAAVAARRRRRAGLGGCRAVSRSPRIVRSIFAPVPMPLHPPPETAQVPAPAAMARAATAEKLVTTWYPRINALLFDRGHALPYPAVHVQVEADPVAPGVPAYASGNAIHLWAGYIDHQDEDDFEGMVIHELTHVNQHGKADDSDGWVVEGVADYVRHKYFAKDIAAKLRLTPDGRLRGYAQADIYLHALQQQGVDLRPQGYHRRYTVASTFLYWLELRKDKRIVHEISVALEHGRFTPALFARRCGAPLDALWAEFIAESERTPS